MIGQAGAERLRVSFDDIENGIRQLTLNTDASTDNNALDELLSAAREVQTAALADDQPWPPVKQHTHIGKAVLEVVEQRGGLPTLVTEHEELAAFHGDDHLPLLETFYRGHRPLLPRIRNFKDLIFHRPDRDETYEHIDALFGEPINWRLIEEHWVDLMRVVPSIREARLSSVTLLRRLRHDSRRSKIYRAFRELGRAVRTMVLLRHISDGELREHITRATDMSESFNDFSRWPAFGNDVIAENEPEAQEKMIKFNTLVADLVMYHTAIDISVVLNAPRGEGFPVYRPDVATMAPYQQDDIRRFGDFVYDLDAPLEDMHIHLDLLAQEQEATSSSPRHPLSPASTHDTGRRSRGRKPRYPSPVTSQFRLATPHCASPSCVGAPFTVLAATSVTRVRCGPAAPVGGGAVTYWEPIYPSTG
ncbi:Tn3 family transposase [Streptosporangium sp. CA-135522]|uniref:Tn3 family transposase n=1 Tax=Streptosporangium sp. CA-135522 TaxID=3240072 RepID=UPI003D8E415C